MADGYISQITLPNNTTFDLRDPHLKLYTGTCSTAAGTAIKNVVTDGAFTLEKGAVIFVNFTATNTAAVGNLKLKINGEADANAKPIKYLVNANGPANIPGVGYLRENQTYMFRYDGTNWVADLNYYYDSNNFANMVGHYNNILARKAITAESLIVGDSTGYEKVAANVTFDLAYPIVWCTAAVNANASNYANMYLQHYDRNIATGAKSGFTSSANKVIYLIVTISGNIATIDSDIITDTIPTVENGKVYIVLGKLGAQSTGANYFFLYPEHKMFWYKDGEIKVYSGINTYNIKDLVPITSKTYNAELYNSSSGENFYQNFATVEPYDYNAIWTVHYRITITASGHSDYTEICDVSISGRSNTYYTYKVYNSLVTYSIYNHMLLNSSSASTPHELGYRMANSYGATNVQKVVKVELLEQINCTVILLDSLKLYTSALPTGYAAWRSFNATSNGLQETGDSDTTGRDYSHSGYNINGPDFKLAHYSLFGYDRNQKIQGISLYSNDYSGSATTSISTTRVYNTAGIDYTRGLWYTNSAAIYAKNANVDSSPAEFYYNYDLRYSDNCWPHKTTVSELGIKARRPIFFRGIIGEDGLFYLRPLTVTHNGTSYPRAWTQDIPSTEDNYVYWLIGYPYYNSSYAESGYQVNLITENKLYWYHNNRFQEYLPNTTKADSVPLSGVTDADDLKAIEALSGTSGFLKKTAENTWTLDTSEYLKLDGSNNMTADVNIIAGDTDKFVNFWYNTNKKAGASWRIGMLGSGANDTNYFVIESGTSTTSATTWNRAIQIGQNTYDITIKGDLIPAATDTKTLGTSSYKWSNVYATTFTGNLTGNASGTASNITGILALANFTKGAANTALMGKGTSSNPAYVSVSPSISITDGTSTAAPKINLTVLDISGTAQDLTIASTSVYGVTKLYDGVNSSSTEMAATAKAVKTAYDKAVNIIAESNALVYKGTIDGNASATNGGAYTVAANCGDVYIASTAGYVNGLYVELGDMLICNTDETVQATSSNYTTIRNKWDIIQTSNGTVSTSETSVAEGEIPVFKGTTGRFIQNSEKSFTVNAPTSSSGDSTIPTSKAVWTTVNTAIIGLDVTAVGGGTGEYVSKISEADGKISATISTTSVSNTWTAGTTAGPTIKTTVNGITGTAVAIPSASNTASGIVTTGNQTFAGIKTFANTTASTSTDSGAVLVSGGLGVTGQVTAARLAANGSNTSYNLYVNGTSLLNGNTTVNGNLVPGADNTKILGSTDAKWSKLYVGSSESYGNAYQPVYWNNGVPTVSYPVQYSTWSISSGDNTATLTGTDIFTADTYVISLVVTSGEQYLNGPITWTSAANTLTLSTAATSGDVEGYVLTSIGTATGATCASSSVTT